MQGSAGGVWGTKVGFKKKKTPCSHLFVKGGFVRNFEVPVSAGNEVGGGYDKIGLKGANAGQTHGEEGSYGRVLPAQPGKKSRSSSSTLNGFAPFPRGGGISGDPFK